MGLTKHPVGMDPVIECTDCSFRYGEDLVVDEVRFDVGHGEAVALAGPNGAGKTTLLRLITGLLRPTSGTACIGGCPSANLSGRERAKRMAVVPQDTEFHFPYRVIDVVRMGRTPHLGFWGFETKADIEAAEQAIALCDLEDLAGRLVTRISGGERQRAIIARALAQRPQLLLLDEPMRSLDLRHTQDILDLLHRLRQQTDLSICMVSHDLNAVARFADRIVLMKNGRVTSDGPPGEVLTRDRLRETFDLEVEVLHTAEGHPVIVPA